MWVADGANSRVEEFSSAGVYLNKQIVTGSSEFPLAPNDVALDGHGDLFVTGSAYGSIQKFSIETGQQLAIVLTYVNGYSPQEGLAVDQQGNVWVADNGSDRVREFSNNLEFKLAFGWGVKDGEAKFETCTSECQVGLSGAGNGEFNNPTGLVIDGTNTLWVVDSGNNRVERLSLDGEYLTQLGSGGSGPGQLSGPMGVAATNGSLYVADTGNNRIDRWNISPLTPVVTSLSPATGAEAGGTQITITGAGFTSASAVSFGEHSASSFEVVSASTIKATAPPGANTVDVKVTTPGGTSATSAADRFTYKVAPTVSAVAPDAAQKRAARRSRSPARASSPARRPSPSAKRRAPASGHLRHGSNGDRAGRPEHRRRQGHGPRRHLRHEFRGQVHLLLPVAYGDRRPAQLRLALRRHPGHDHRHAFHRRHGRDVSGRTRPRASKSNRKRRSRPRHLRDRERSMSSSRMVWAPVRSTQPTRSPTNRWTRASSAPSAKRAPAQASSAARTASPSTCSATCGLPTGTTTASMSSLPRANSSSPSAGASRTARNGWRPARKTAGRDLRLRATGSSGAATSTTFRMGAIAVNGSDVWVVDGGNDRIEKFTTSGEFVEAIGTLVGPEGIAISPSGDIWVSSYGYGALQSSRPQAAKYIHGP